SWTHAVMTLLLGLAIRAVWTTAPTPAPALPPQARQRDRLRIVQLLLAIVIGGLGAWLGYKAIVASDSRSRIASAGLVATAVMSPLLALPILGTGAIAAQNGKMQSIMSSIVAIVLLNLCCLLPLVIISHYARQLILAHHNGAHGRELLSNLLPVPFPLAVWRVDTVLLMVLGLLLIPISLGRWTLRKHEGAALAAVYTAYLFVSAAVVIRL